VNIPFYQNIRRVMKKNNYQEKMAEEVKIYENVNNVHDLPDIFHYWSNKYLREKLQLFGFENVKEFYCIYLQKISNLHKGSKKHFLGIGTGNCDFEIEVTRTLLDSGVSNFSFHCLDINPHMLERGRISAQNYNVADYITFINEDINSWSPPKGYHAIIANQSLHHFIELEILFEKIYDSLLPKGYFLTNDMVGRNGHMRWPEALDIVNMIWGKLPDKYKYNHQLKRFENKYDNWDCSKEGFEGVRSQDILPLLVKSNFHFDLFFCFGNIINIFIERAFGHNFDADSEIDKKIIDHITQIDEKCIEAGIIKPTQMIAALSKENLDIPKYYKHLTPHFCTRWTITESEINSLFNFV
jgi:SAM-dependent methyltransferase